MIVSVSVSPSCLLKGCVQRVRMRPGEHGGRSNDHNAHPAAYAPVEHNPSEDTGRTNRHTHYHKHSTRRSILFSLCCSRIQKERAQKDEVVVGPSLECMHRHAVLAAPRRRPGAAAGPCSWPSRRPRPRRRCPRPLCTGCRPPPTLPFGCSSRSEPDLSQLTY